MKDKFYEATKDEQARLAGLLTQVGPQFAAKAAIYARKKFGMRSITHFTSAWIAKNVHGSTWARKFFENVVHRVDDVTEILSCYATLNGSPSPYSNGAGKKGADVMTFHDRARYERFNRKDSVVSIAERITNESGGTNFHSIFECAQAAYDRFIILSDMQAWVGHAAPADAFKGYCQKHRCNPHVYCFNLVSYGDAQFPANKVFETMALLETDRLALVKEIKAIELGRR